MRDLNKNGEGTWAKAAALPDALEPMKETWCNLSARSWAQVLHVLISKFSLLCCYFYTCPMFHLLKVWRTEHFSFSHRNATVFMLGGTWQVWNLGSDLKSDQFAQGFF